jgi:hypothetical protein
MKRIRFKESCACNALAPIPLSVSPAVKFPVSCNLGLGMAAPGRIAH